MPVTIRDVAKQLHLSITTVSRALDGYLDISDATRLRVLQAAHELGHQPNSLFSQPPLTTVDQPVPKITKLLVRMLLAEINRDTLPERHVVIQTVLRFRHSTIKGGQA